MKTSLAATLALGLALAACSVSHDPADAAGPSLADRATAEIREKFATEDMDLGKGKAGLPSAGLSPNGDLVIDGKKVAINDAQRALLLDYRTRLAGVAEAGARVGIAGAALAGEALKEAAKGALTGDKRSVDERLKGKTADIEALALQLCDQLPGLLAAQQKAAAAVPEFAPYGDMDLDDVENCKADITHDDGADNEETDA